MSKSYEKWDIWTAYVPYDNKPGGKSRPVILLSENEESLLVLVLPVSSHRQKNRVGGYRELIHWAEAGLRKPSSVLCRNKTMIPKDNIKKYVGRLTNSDIEAVEETLQFWDNILF